MLRIAASALLPFPMLVKRQDGLDAFAVVHVGDRIIDPIEGIARDHAIDRKTTRFIKGNQLGQEIVRKAVALHDSTHREPIHHAGHDRKCQGGITLPG